MWRILDQIWGITLFLTSAIVIAAAQTDSTATPVSAGVVGAIVVSTLVVFSFVIITTFVCVVYCNRLVERNQQRSFTHRAGRQQMPTTIVTTTPASSVSYNITTRTAIPYPTTTTAPYSTNPPPIPGQYAYPKQAAYPPEPSDPTLTAEAPPSYNLAANYPAPPTYTDQNP